MSIRMSLLALGVAGLAAPAIARPPVPVFVPGNLAVSQATPTVFGSGGAFNGQAAAARVREFGLTTTLSGAFTAVDIALPSTGTGMKLTLGATGSEGMLTLSNNGQYLMIGGYDWTAGTASPNGTSIGASLNNTGTASTSTTVNRTVATIDAAASTSFSSMYTAYSGGNFRSVTSLDGTSFITGGASLTNTGNVGTGGVRTFNPSVNNFSTPVVLTPNTGINSVNYDLAGQLLFSGSSTAGASFRGVNFVTPQGTALRLYGMSSLALQLSSTDFWFRDEYTLYVADDGSTTTALGGLQKWTKNPLTGDWSLAYRLTGGLGAGLRGLAGTVDALGNVILYATTAESQTQNGPGNFLVGVIDAGNTSTFTVLSQAPVGTVYKGVDFTPGTTLVPAPGAAAIFGLGALALRRRRR